MGTSLLAGAESRSNFLGRSELVRVLQVFVPTVIYVLLIGFLGLYVSSAIFIAFFMAWLGKYPLYKIVPVAVLIPVALFSCSRCGSSCPCRRDRSRPRSATVSLALDKLRRPRPLAQAE